MSDRPRSSESNTPRKTALQRETTHLKVREHTGMRGVKLCLPTRPPKLIPAQAGRLDRLPAGTGPLSHRCQRSVERTAEVGQLVERRRLNLAGVMAEPQLGGVGGSIGGAAPNFG
jgi:hypothetical protein